MPFRDSILAISPPFLAEEGGVAEAVQYAEGTVMDAIGDWVAQGVMASMPGVGTPDALYLTGRDMGIDRGPTETDDHYIERLQGAVDSHRVQGSPVELIKQLAAWFSPAIDTPIRLVSHSAVWHTIDLTTHVVTKTVVGTNWVWDANTTWWWRGWVILDSSAAPWTRDIWDTVALWGDGGTWGSDATIAQVTQLQHWVDKWKPAHIHAVNIIITFDADLFEVADASPPNPDGAADTALWRTTVDAIFWNGA